MPDTPHQLEYAPPLKWHRRRWMRRTVFILVIVLPCIAIAPLVRRTYDRAIAIYDQRRWMKHTISPEHVIAEPSPAEFDHMMAARQVADSVVMVHGRTAQGGTPRHILVSAAWLRRWQYLRFPGQAGQPHALSAMVMRPITWSDDGGVGGYGTLETEYFARVPVGTLKFFAGQPDPSDESHFTIDYETPAGRGTIDAWLLPDDTVKFQIRSGPAATQPAN